LNCRFVDLSVVILPRLCVCVQYLNSANKDFFICENETVLKEYQVAPSSTDTTEYPISLRY